MDSMGFLFIGWWLVVSILAGIRNGCEKVEMVCGVVGRSDGCMKR